jgi:acyl-CoA synthetase (NDP forming)
MIKATKVYRLLKGFRGETPANIDAIADIIVKVGLLLNDHNEIKELDINPILANQETATAVDARVIVARGGGQAVVR